MRDSLELGGRVLFDGKLDVFIANRVLSRRDIADINRAYGSGDVPMVVLQVDRADVVQNYFLSGKWIKPKEPYKILEAIEAIARHLKIDIKPSKLVADCLMLGV